MLEKREIKIVFLWHWQKRLTNEKKPVFAVPDSLIHAIGKLSLEYNVTLIALSKNGDYDIYSANQNIQYLFRTSQAKLIFETLKINPHFILMNHHNEPYDDLQRKIESLNSKKLIYYSSPITKLNEYHKTMDYHLVHHEYQKEILETKGINPQKIFVAPKTADLHTFKPYPINKKWDCIYPARGGIGYWKRPELAIEACKINNQSIVMPGAKIPPKYNWVTTFNEWKTPQELVLLYNQSRCLVITSNDEEMGPRVIPEAAACNIPIVCCNDSRACVSHVTKIGGLIADPNPADIAAKIKLAQQKEVNTRQRMIELELDYDLIYKVLSSILKNELSAGQTSEKNPKEHWDKKYSSDPDRWKSSWRLVLYDWALEDIDCSKCSILDIGSGPGYGLKRIKDLRPEVEVCGVDFSTEASKISVVPYIQKDILIDDLSPLSADYVLCIQTLEHFKNPLHVLDRLLPIAKKKLILTVPYGEDISNHTEHESVFNKKTFKAYPVEKISIIKRSKGKLMKVVINKSKDTKDKSLMLRLLSHIYK